MERELWTVVEKSLGGSDSNRAVVWSYHKSLCLQLSGKTWLYGSTQRQASNCRYSSVNDLVCFSTLVWLKELQKRRQKGIEERNNLVGESR